MAGPGFRFAPSELRIPCRLWNTGSPLSRVMTVVGMSANMPSRSRGWMHPSFARNFPYPPVRGRRESRVRAAPAVSCANCTRKNAHEHTGPAEASDFPCAVVLRLIRTLPGDRAFLPPSPARLSASLTPASGCQDHTISPSASSALVRSAVRVHRIPAPRW